MKEHIRNKSDLVSKGIRNFIKVFLDSTTLTLWMPLRPYPGSDADLHTKSARKKKEHVVFFLLAVTGQCQREELTPNKKVLWKLKTLNELTTVSAELWSCGKHKHRHVTAPTLSDPLQPHCPQPKTPWWRCTDRQEGGGLQPLMVLLNVAVP